MGEIIVDCYSNIFVTLVSVAHILVTCVFVKFVQLALLLLLLLLTIAFESCRSFSCSTPRPSRTVSKILDNRFCVCVFIQAVEIARRKYFFFMFDIGSS